MHVTGGGGGEEDDTASRRRKDLLAEARKKRLEWIDSEDPVSLLTNLAARANGASPSRGVEQRRKTTVGALLDETPGLEAVMSSARQYVAFLNSLLEEDPEKIEYIVAPLSSKDLDGDEGIAIPIYEPGVPVYEVFLKKLKHPSAADVVKAMQRFVSQFVERQRTAKTIGLTDSNAPAESLHTFLQSIETEMRKCLVWKSEGAVQWEDTKECLEKFMMIKLHPYLFSTAEKEELIKRDAALSDRLAALSFLGPENLDIKSLSSMSLEEAAKLLKPAVKDLREMSKKKAPKDMIDGIMACSKTLTRLLIDTHNDGTLPGADEFLPALILVVKQANPKGLHSAIETIQRYRHPSKLVSEAGYIFTHLVSAVHFLENADASQLTISPEDLERLLAEHQANSRARVATLQLDNDDDQQAMMAGDDSLGLSNSGGLLNPPSNGYVKGGSKERGPEASSGSSKGVNFTPRSVHDVRRSRGLGGSHGASLDSVSNSSTGRPVDLHTSAWARSSPSKDSNKMVARAVTIRELLEKVRALSGGDQSPYYDLAKDEAEAMGDIKGTCRYYHTTPDNVRLSQIGGILDEYRDLASLCDELIAIKGLGWSLNGPPYSPPYSTPR